MSFGTVAASFTFLADGTIIATAPAQAAGTVDVRVTTTSGTSSTSSADHFVYSAASSPTVSAVSPNSGGTVGGTVVTITGSNFSSASAVTFGTTAASFTVLSATTILATAPAGTAGTVDVTVTTPSGTSSTSSADHFTWSTTSAPTVTGLGTTSGGTAGGTVVLITGTGFSAASAVDFGSFSEIGKKPQIVQFMAQTATMRRNQQVEIVEEIASHVQSRGQP